MPTLVEQVQEMRRDAKEILRPRMEAVDAIHDTLVRFRDGPDVRAVEDDGGGVHVLHDPRSRSGLGIVRGVPVRELVVITDPSFTVGDLARLAAELEVIGCIPCVKFHRDSAGVIDGFTLCREIAA